MNKVLLTGATGFLGRQILRALGETSIKVVPVVRAGKEQSVANFPNVEKVVGSSDIFREDEAWWVKHCQGVDIVIHAAWYAEPGKYLQATQNIDCLVGSLVMAKGAASAGVKRLVGVGTCFEYDLDVGVLSTNTPLKPLTPYAAAKAALYIGLSQLLPARSVEFAWCRMFYLYGEGEDERRLFSYLHKQLKNGEPAELTSGKQIRDFLDVEDAAKLVTKFALSNQQGAINVCSGIPITVRQLAERIADEYGRRDLLKFGVHPDNFVDPPCVVGEPSRDLLKAKKLSQGLI